MTWSEAFRTACRAILANRMRSILTTLGIVIGVASVVAMMAVGAGAKLEVEQAFAAIGTNLLLVLPGSVSTGGVQGGAGSRSSLTWDDLAALKAEIPSIRAAAPVLRKSMTLVGDGQNWTTNVTGTSPDYFDIRHWPMAAGSAFNQGDVDGAGKVLVLGQTVSDKLFGPNANPVGQIVRIGNMIFRTVGVATKKGQSSTGQDYDDAVFVPFTTYTQKLQGGLNTYLRGAIMAQATGAETTARAEEEIKLLLRERHRLSVDRDDDFTVRNLADVAGAQRDGVESMSILLASVAAISLFVGGIGIMNIMLVSVTERTREIGLRMALGATPFDVMVQFVVEALALSLLGGLCGIALGVLSATWIANTFGWPTLLQANVIIVAFGFSSFVGIVFGLFPARKASRLDPIAALRTE